MEELGATVGTAYVTSLILDWLKHQPWFPFMQIDTAKLNRAFSILVAFAVSMGLHYTFDPTTRVLAITIPTLAEALSGAIHAATQFGFQDLSYRLAIKDRTTAKVEEKKALIQVPGTAQ